MKNLIRLRHLVAMNDEKQFSPVIFCPMIAMVGKLTSLQELNICIKKERNYKIEELKGLILIRKLHVNGLENVGCPEEASMAKLDEKEQLRELRLEWNQDDDNEGNDLNMDEQQQILDCLQPHSNLKELKIIGYRGVKPAKWMDFELVNKLQRITLGYCSRLEHLPSFDKLPFLKYLSLEVMPLVKQLHCDCQQLEELSLLFMEELEEISHSDEISGQWCPCLRDLSIKYSPELSILPSLSLSLKSIYLKDVGLVVLPELWLDSESRNSSSSSSSLSYLEILKCSKLTSLDNGLLLQQPYLTALKTLRIHDCDVLVDFPKGGLQHFCSLKNLEIWHCPNLQLDSSGPARNDENFLLSSLQSLCISHCAEGELTSLLGGIQTSLSKLSLGCIKSLPSSSVQRKLIAGLTLAIDRLNIEDPMLLLMESFKNLTSLRKLYIYDCSNLESISGQMEEWLLQMRTTLESLYLYRAFSLKSLPDSLQTFSSLSYLDIYDARNLESLPKLPSSLERIIISGCSETLKERCRNDEGADWPNIRHISDIVII